MNGRRAGHVAIVSWTMLASTATTRPARPSIRGVIVCRLSRRSAHCAAAAVFARERSVTRHLHEADAPGELAGAFRRAAAPAFTNTARPGRHSIRSRPRPGDGADTCGAVMQARLTGRARSQSGTGPPSPRDVAPRRHRDPKRSAFTTERPGSPRARSEDL